MLVVKMTLKLRNIKIGTARKQRMDISKLKDTLIKEKLSNTLSILQDETALTIDDFNTAMMESAKETIRYTNTCESESISLDTWRTIEERRQLKKKALDSKSPSLKERAVAQYREKDKQVKTSARRDNRQYVERLATESDAERKDMKTAYQITRKLRGNRGQNQDLTVKVKDGSTITEERQNKIDGENTFSNSSTDVIRLYLQTIVRQNKTLTSNLGPSPSRRAKMQSGSRRMIKHQGMTMCMQRC